MYILLLPGSGDVGWLVVGAILIELAVVGVDLFVVVLVGVVLNVVGVRHGISPQFSASIFVPLHELPCKHILFLPRIPPSQEELQVVHSLQLDHTVYKNI